LWTRVPLAPPGRESPVGMEPVLRMPGSRVGPILAVGPSAESLANRLVMIYTDEDGTLVHRA